MSAGEIIAFDKYHGFLVGNQDTTHGLIVVQEWWGLNEQIKNTSKRFANQGFLVLAPDLYYGKIAHSADEAHHLMNGLDWQDAQAMIAEGVKVLKSRGVNKVGITGFCMGGAITIAAAANIPDISAAAPFYGIPPLEVADPKNIKVPVQAHFGELDDQKGFSDPENAKKLEETLKQTGIHYEFHWYKNAGHAFMNNERPEAFNQEADTLAFVRTVEFFKEKL